MGSEQPENDRLEIERQQLEIERLRIELERWRIKSELKGLSATSKTRAVNLTAVLAAVGSVLALAIPGVAVITTYLNHQQELQLAQLQNEAEEDRLWRSELLKFVDASESGLLSPDPDQWRAVRAIVETTFPTKYAGPFLNKLQLTRAFSQSAGEPECEDAYQHVLQPLVDTLNYCAAAFDKGIETGELIHLKTLSKGNEKARDILVNNAEFVPLSLKTDALRLLEYYDGWLEQNSLQGYGEQAEQLGFSARPSVSFPFRSAERFREELKKREESGLNEATEH